ncbi:tyrosine-protein phosphatase [Paraburkholderia sp. Ac-20340]|uniref:tyrosine-protein phosphatase n=1 Tax=Paraburkholderia sp. Ac-20340 TaxID=2703888 RepID=UPI001F11E7D8|nr:tyrosine-protein phosphatase [Paraburkholderia sp. Ac-20340]
MIVLLLLFHLPAISDTRAVAGWCAFFLCAEFMTRTLFKLQIAGVSLCIGLAAGSAFAQDSDRPVPMQHIQNLRDLGGLVGADGKVIAPHRLYRSGNPALGTAGDFERLDAMRLDAVVDFRADSEKTSAEAAFAERFPWRADPVLAGDLSPAAIVPMLKRSTPAQMHAFMVRIYRQFPVDYQEQFARFLKRAEADQTLLFHCTAGKDRTGFATVLLLSALGVDRATVVANYLESNRVNAGYNALAIGQLREIGVEPAVVLPLLEVDADYIGAAMQVIDARYGGMQRYLRDVLHVDVDLIRRNYLLGRGVAF